MQINIPEKVVIAALQQRYYSKKESANFLGISVPTFTAWTKKYKLTPLIIDGIVCWDKKDLEDFMDQRKVRL